MSKPMCGDCFYYDTEEESCHRYAPKPKAFLLDDENDGEATQIFVSFPIIAEANWCGEFKQMEDLNEV